MPIAMTGTLTTEINIESNIHKDHSLTERTSTTKELASLSIEAGPLLKTRHVIRTPDNNTGILYYSGISIKHKEMKKRNETGNETL